MAREIIERLVDDLDGGSAAETVMFGLDGASYEIDLNKRNAAALRKALERYIGGARRTAGPKAAKAAKPAKAPKGKAATSPGKRDYDLGALREWAAANEIEVPARGRIPLAVVEQYSAAGGR